MVVLPSDVVEALLEACDTPQGREPRYAVGDPVVIEALAPQPGIVHGVWVGQEETQDAVYAVQTAWGNAVLVLPEGALSPAPAKIKK